MPARPTTTIGLALAIGVVAGVALERFVLHAPDPAETTAARPSSDADARETKRDTVALASRPEVQRTREIAAAGVRADAARSPEPAVAMTPAEARSAIEHAMQWAARDTPPEVERDGERAFALLDGAEKPDVATSLVLAKWLAWHGKTSEAVRRVVAQIGRRTPTGAEIGWLSSYDPRAAVAAARTLVERRPGSPDALQTLAECLAGAGDEAAAFDAYAAALRAGLSADNGAFELARLDPARAIPILLELYGGRDVGSGAGALVEAYLRVGRVADARREVVRLVAATDSYVLLQAAAHLEPEATAAALAGRCDDPATAAAGDPTVLWAYAVALRRSGHGAEAQRVYRAIAETRTDAFDALVEMLRCDAITARPYVESHLPDERHPLDRIRLLALLGRSGDATGEFERLTGNREPGPEEWAAIVPAAPDRALGALRRGADAERGADEGLNWALTLAQALADSGRSAEAKAVWAAIPDRDLDLVALAEKASLK